MSRGIQLGSCAFSLSGYITKRSGDCEEHSLRYFFFHGDFYVRLHQLYCLPLRLLHTLLNVFVRVIVANYLIDLCTDIGR